MPDKGQVDTLRQGAKDWNRWRTIHPDIKPDLSKADLNGAGLRGTDLNGSDLNGSDLSGADLGKANLRQAKLSGADLSGADLSGADLDGAHLRQAVLRQAVLRQAVLRQADLRGANLRQADLRGVKLTGANLSGADLSEADLSEANLEGADLSEVNLSGANLGKANLRQANLSEANLSGANLSGANLTGANLINANLLRAIFNYETIFQGADVAGCKVDSYALECLKEYGGLTIGDRMNMNIHDDVATLRSSYSGYLQWIHLAALIGFVFPYLWFIVTQWGNAKFLSNTIEKTMPLWQALGQFIFNGGVDWERGLHLHYSFLLFLIAFLYNILRAALLIKTKKLELTQVSSGLPSAFNMRDKIIGRLPVNWLHLFILSKIGFYIYLVVVLVNLLHFFTMEIPLNR